MITFEIQVIMKEKQKPEWLCILLCPHCLFSFIPTWSLCLLSQYKYPIMHHHANSLCPSWDPKIDNRLIYFLFFFQNMQNYCIILTINICIPFVGVLLASVPKDKVKGNIIFFYYSSLQRVIGARTTLVFL